MDISIRKGRARGSGHKCWACCASFKPNQTLYEVYVKGKDKTIELCGGECLEVHQGFLIDEVIEGSYDF